MTIKKNLLLLLLAFVMPFSMLLAQEAEAETKVEPIWTSGGSIGLDLAQLALINPKVGSGENKLGLGGLNTLFAKYKKDNIMWDSEGNLQLAVQRLGDSDNPFTKNLDLLRLNSKFGYGFSKKLYGALLASFESLLLDTYSDQALSSSGENTLQAKFLAPATFLLAPGLDYVHDDHFSVFLSPFAYKTIMVMEDELAALGVHGNPWTSASDYENMKHELGTNLKAKYKNTFMKKFIYSGELNLFYDYMADEHALNSTDVIFINDFGVEIFKGLSLNLLLDTRWDKDIASVTDEAFAPGEEFEKWMITESFVIKYNYLIK